MVHTVRGEGNGSRRTRHIRSPIPSYVQAAPPYRGIEREQFMKSRSILRSLCIGAALLMPAGGLAVLGAGTAGASTTSLVSVSKVKIGTFVSVTLIGTTLFSTSAVGTQQVTITKVTTQGGGINARLTGTLRVTVITTGGTKSIHKVKIRSGASITITGPTSQGLKGCEIVDLPVLDYNSTTALKWTSKTNSISGVSITGPTGPTSCTGRIAIKDFITGHRLDSTLTFSAA
jgi:hypothetical protein